VSNDTSKAAPDPTATPAVPAWETAQTTPIAPITRVDAVVPEPTPADVPKLFYSRGKRWPRAIAWFGFKSFWGHL
jgi:hypothetical protein